MLDGQLPRTPGSSSGHRRCEAHGLHFDPNVATGCVLCRAAQHAAEAPERRGWHGALRLIAGAALCLSGLGAAAYVRNQLRVQASAVSGADEVVQVTAANPAEIPADPAPAVQIEGTDAEVPERPSHEVSQSLRLPSDYDELTDGFERVSANGAGAAALFSKWAIEVYIPSTTAWSASSNTHGNKPDAAEIAAVLARFVDVLTVYPAQFVAALEFKRLLVVKDLHHKGVRAGMIAMAPYRAIVGAASRNSSIHHELFHMADFRMVPAIERQWLQLNPADFRYQGSGRSVVRDHQGRMSTLTALTADAPGFVSRYALANGEEDRAELFAAMLTDYDYVMTRCAADAVLRTKVALLKKMLANLSADMGDSFWETRRGLPAERSTLE